MDFSQSFFENEFSIPKETKVIFVADLFVEEYVGGAELTSEALIQSSPLPVYKLKSKDLTMDLLQEHQDKFWIFGNFSQIDLNLIPAIMANMKYSVLEYDYKFCQYRSPDKHENETGECCDCHMHQHGKLINAFYASAKSLWFMSEKQMEIYFDHCSLLKKEKCTVLSSVFAPATLTLIRALRDKVEKQKIERKRWIILGSKSWIKGFENAKDYCESNGLDYEVVWNIPYAQLLEKLSKAEGFVYLPNGGDTCPRMVIEAKLLGCELILNDHVQHKDEEWFNPNEDSDDSEITQIEQYLYAARDWFWNGIKAEMEYVPTISGYTTTRNCISQNYPFEAAIHSMLEFCDEVVVLDCGSSDGTWETLKELSNENSSLIVKRHEFDYSDERFALFDGQSKAIARELCTSDFCWQQDSDEIVHESDGSKILDILERFPANVNLLALPVIEYWGGQDKVRVDINPWKWRLSRNLPHITHGVPMRLRKGVPEKYYAMEGTDGCDYIHKESGDIIPFANFYTGDVEMLRRSALSGNEEHLKNYEKWFNLAVNELPGVFHFSWWDISRKIHSFKGYWAKHWKSLYNIEIEDTVENNVMFNVPWSEVTEEMIELRGQELSEKTGGWIFHQKWDGTCVPHIICDRDIPKFIQYWI